jgi:hypothetical protein
MELLLSPHCPIHGSDLLCPFCESEYLHHSKIEIYDRQEDDDAGVHVSVDAASVTLDSYISNNPCLRRRGLKIHFWCEECSRVSILTFAQDEGTTNVRFLGREHPADL